MRETSQARRPLAHIQLRLSWGAARDLGQIALPALHSALNDGKRQRQLIDNGSCGTLRWRMVGRLPPSTLSDIIALADVDQRRVPSASPVSSCRRMPAPPHASAPVRHAPRILDDLGCRPRLTRQAVLDNETFSSPVSLPLAAPAHAGTSSMPSTSDD
ncbi:hypothetical protein BD626DRAFT_171706 [Schizophyllum amplum]|uniref:Uncharacterized protein n=1 Tax=Schizophyllum amplum TaxID=97359 RepID=A0A550CR66_9AGAR|nr:hypothetical protein BD626DRAFT_171706 [Auriculariopsis ampla]